jgi:hypothetical protein
VAPDLELQRKAEGERSEDPKKRSRSSIEKGVRGLVDLVEEAKVLKQGAQPLIGEDTCQQIFHSGR